MAFIQCDFFSESLGLSCSMNVILPQATAGQVGMTGEAAHSAQHPVLWLLHGGSDDHTIWMRRTAIERYVAPLGMAVVMPDANLSLYHNMVTGPQYGTFIGEELPQIARSFFPLSDRREDNFIAGLSMGGYGAMFHALQHPERFAAAASLSGVLDVHAFANDPNERRQRICKHIFGDLTEHLQGSDADLLELLATHHRIGTELPKLYACCGTEDELLTQSRRFAKKCDTLAIPLTYQESKGQHEWGYWDRQIQSVLSWIHDSRSETQE